ncbi:LodA/GoxA family CTQ-dependent oxidase [Arsenophonus sp.]|uniref:LodA/GoxA family CTQ-dependent oxidase n=1 Tax=Arsenophonus sp. TaxID=1872640 RepID=UPI002862A0F7|nr:LodA/GoxA family CTQ-dependent oxidase [Arsenophonus sp.]MDR5615771.1 LodA/GoxA family CTQ-dependent oxidase [Arsenophonus sp.]
MNKDININKNKPAPEVAGALGDMLADSTSQITVIIPESANLKNYDLLTIHWASLSEESTDKSYPLPITKEKAGKSYSYVISEEKIKKINSTSVKIWYSVQQAGSTQTQISDILTLIIPSSLAIDKRIVYAKIHPGIGVGRVGNSENEFYIGPEYANAAQQEFGATRDRTGAIKRQAARFRIYGYNKQGVAVAELTPDMADIEWKVELANKKSSWYEFYACHGSTKN